MSAPGHATPRSPCWAGVLLVTLTTGSVSGQVQGYPVGPDAATAPPVVGLPVEPFAPVPRVVTDLPVESKPCPPLFPPMCPAEPAMSDGGFRYRTCGGWAVEGFPRTLLWEPPMASLREPRFLLMPNTLTSDTSDQTLDAAIGNTLGVVRVGRDGPAPRWQLDLFAVTFARLSQYDYLVNSDYRFGSLATFACGPWHGKAGYEHTSTHLGDETLTRTGRRPFDYIKDELTVGVGRLLWHDSIRLYGQAGWAFFIDVPGDPSPFRFDLGVEWYRRRSTGFLGQPFAAGNVEFNGVTDYSPNLSLQAGWQWRDPSRRLSQARIFAQYYTGHSIYGQLFREREDWVGIGLAADF